MGRRRKSAKTRAANARSRARQRAKAKRSSKFSPSSVVATRDGKKSTSKLRTSKSITGGLGLGEKGRVATAAEAIAAARARRKQVQGKKDKPKLSRNYGQQPAVDPTGVGRPTSIPEGARWSKSKNMLVHKGQSRKPWSDGTAATGKEPTRGKSGQNTRRGSGLKGSISSIGKAQRSRATEAMVDKFRGGGYQNKAFGMGREQRGYGMQQTPRTMPDFMQGARERRESAQNRAFGMGGDRREMIQGKTFGRPNVFSDFGASNAIRDIMKEKRSTVRRAIDSAKGKPDVIPEGARWSKSKNMLVEKGQERKPWTAPTPNQPTPRPNFAQQTAPTPTRTGTSSYNPATGRMEYTSTPSDFSRSSQRPAVRPTVNFNPSTGSMERGAPQRPPTTGELGARPQRPQSKGGASPTRRKGDSAPIQAAPRADVMPRTTARQPVPGTRPAPSVRAPRATNTVPMAARQAVVNRRTPAPTAQQQAPIARQPAPRTRQSMPRARQSMSRQLPNKGSIQSLARSMGPMRKNVGGFKLPTKSQIKK